MDRAARRLIIVCIALGGAALAAGGGLTAAATWLHEGGHAAAALATGGRVLSTTAGPDGAGATRTEGGNQPFILASGYLAGIVLAAALAATARRLTPRFPALATAARTGALGLLLLTLADATDDVFVQAGAPSDATLLAAATGVPAWAWGLGWLAAGAAVAVVTLWRPRLRA